MNEKLPKLSADSRALLDSGRAPEAVPTEVRARLWGQIANAMLVAPSPLPHAPRLVPEAPAALASGKTLVVVKLACAILGLAGASAAIVLATSHSHRGLPIGISKAPPAVPPAVAPPSLPPAPTIQAPRPGRPMEQVSPPKQLTTVRHHPPLEGTPSEADLPLPTDQDLGAERSLIVRARSALQRGAPLDALAALQAHEERFRAGSLAEERDELRIQALAASGDRAGAEAAAAQFTRTYPHGLMGPAVRATLRGEP